jgi:hypothetical protein
VAFASQWLVAAISGKQPYSWMLSIGELRLQQRRPMTHLYSYPYGDCGPDHWWSWPILKITAKRIVIGGWHYGAHHLDRQQVEAGKCYRPDKMYTEDQKRATDPEGKLAVMPIPYDPETFAPKPDPEPTPELLEFAKALAEDWFRQHLDDAPMSIYRSPSLDDSMASAERI